MTPCKGPNAYDRHATAGLPFTARLGKGRMVRSLNRCSGNHQSKASLTRCTFVFVGITPNLATLSLTPQARSTARKLIMCFVACRHHEGVKRAGGTKVATQARSEAGGSQDPSRSDIQQPTPFHGQRTCLCSKRLQRCGDC